MQERIEMTRVERPTRCSCGEGLRPGERAGQLGGRSELLCLWCLADLQAGRRRTRRRRVETPWPEPALPQPVVERSARRATPAGRQHSSTGLTVVIALLLVAVALYFRPAISGDPPGSALPGNGPLAGPDVTIWGERTPLTGGDPSDTSDIWPPTPADAQDEPLGAPMASTSSSTDFAFLASVPELGGQPVSWDPCRPIHLVLNNDQAPPDADRLLREAVSSVSSATGLHFVIDGPTTEAPTTKRAPVDEPRYGNRWSPVLVAWTDPSVMPVLEGPVAGVAGPTGAPYYTAGQQHWVSGTVYLDGPQFREMLPAVDGHASARAVVMHELGHLVGLDHVPASDQLMYEKNIGQRAFGSGDQAGLRQLGLGPCFSE